MESLHLAGIKNLVGVLFGGDGPLASRWPTPENASVGGRVADRRAQVMVKRQLEGTTYSRRTIPALDRSRQCAA